MFNILKSHAVLKAINLIIDSSLLIAMIFSINNINNSYNVKVQNLLQYSNENGNDIQLCSILYGHSNINDNAIVKQAAKDAITDPSAIKVQVTARQAVLLLI